MWNQSLVLALALGVALFGVNVGIVGGEAESASSCGFEKIAKHLWCSEDGFLEAEDLTKDDESGEQVCRWCLEAPEKVDTCVKVYYTCEDDEVNSLKPGKCTECATSLEKVTSKARIVYECKGCGYQQYETGKCMEDDTEPCHGKALVKACEESGLFPHTSTKKVSK